MLRDSVHAWRRREGWSSDRVCMEIVEAHERMGYDRLTGIEFAQAGAGRDVMRAMRTNVVRITRWLDDVSKDDGLVPTNLVPMVLRALPRDLRIAAAAEMMHEVGLTAEPMPVGASTDSHAALLVELVREVGEGSAAFAELACQADKAALIRAEAELAEALMAVSRSLDCVRRAMVRAAA